MMNKTIVATAALALAAGAFADTIAWWHFDEMDAGTPAPANTITNETVAGVYARAFSYEGSTATENAGAYLPAYAKSFAGLKVVDPVSGASRVNRSAMEFKSARGGADPSGNSGRAYYGGALAVPGGYDLYSPLYGTEAMTVECFVCTTGGVAHSVSPIIAAVDVNDPSNPNAVSDNFVTKVQYALYYETHDYNTGGLCLVLKIDGNAEQQFLWNKTTLVNDGLWHHVAFTYNGSKITLYVDYKADISVAVSGGIDTFGAGTMTWIGGLGAYTGDIGQRRFNGYIDEVRISNAALTPDQFLRLGPVAAPADPDEVLRLRFDSASDRTQLQYAESLSENFSQQAVYRNVAGSYPAEFDKSERSGTNMFDGVFFDGGVIDSAAYHSSTNGAGMANYIEVPKLSNALGLDGAAFGNPSWTVEAFYKSPTNAIDQTLFKMGLDTETVAHVYFRRDNDHSIVGYPQFCFSTNTASMSFGKWEGVNANRMPTPGEWHHIAMVSDADDKCLYCYCDYKYAARFDMKGDTKLMVKSGLPFVVGSAVDGAGQFFDGWIDDVRVTKRALRPQEFLTTHAVGAASPNPLLLAKFENNYDVQSLNDPALSDTGVGQARTGGTAPVFAKTTPGLLVLDGTNGTKHASNYNSAYLDGSRVKLPISRLYESEAYTVEFFSRFTGFREDAVSGSAGILRLVQVDDRTAYNWALYTLKDYPDALGLAVRNATNRADVLYYRWGGDGAASTLPNIVADGKWHHCALTFNPVVVEEKKQTEVSLYYDYNPVGTYVVPFRIYAHPFGQSLVIGESTGETPNLRGYVNSLRFSRGVLPPEKFLGLSSAFGTVIIIQ